MPDFIASEQIQSDIKEFYRKSSNSFLRGDIIRNKNYAQSVIQEKDYIEKMKEVGQLETTLRTKREKERNTINEKRTKVLKEGNSIFK